MNETTAQIRVEGAREVRLLAAALLVLLVAAYLSWTKKDTGPSSDKAAIVDLKPEELLGITMVTRTQTVALERRQIGESKNVPFFSIDSARKRSFVGSDATKTLFESFAPFMALRGLGSQLTEEHLKEAKLERPEGKLILRTKSGDRVFDIGGRSFGARDWYLRSKGGKEVYLVGSRVLSDLEFPEGRFMQRKLRLLEGKEVSGAVLKAGPNERRLLHQNRLSESDAYWADAKNPDQKNETIENYVNKLEGLSATAYVEADALKEATPVLEVSWLEDDAPKEKLAIYRVPDKDKSKYLAVASSTHLPVELPRSTAEQLEQDLAVLLAE